MVEWKKIEEVCTVLTGGDAPRECAKGQLEPTMENPYPIYSNGDETYGFCSTYRVNTDAVTISSIGNVGSVFYRTANFTPIIRLKVVIPSTKLLSTKFLYYSLLDYSFVGTNSSLSSMKAADIKRIKIPIPSLSEQTRIVGILDTFTSAIDNLKEQIAQRRKQYEYYRDQLLDLEGKPRVEMKFITEVAKSFTGLTYKPENVSDSGTLVLRSSNINDDVLSFDDNIFVQMVIPERAKVQENDILICVRNGSKRLVGKSAMITKEAEGMAFGAFMTILRSFAINSKFLFYVWQSEKVRRQYKGDEAMPIAQITAKDFQRIVIPVPSLSEQKRIVSILDTFEASIQNLEAQLKEREKQYEYYRNKLLTFE